MAALERNIKPFMFESLGDAMNAGAVREDKVQEPPPPPTFSEEELAARVKEARDSGFSEGLAQGRKEAEDRNRQAYEQLSRSIEAALPAIQAMENHYLEAAAALKAKMPGLVLAVARQVAGKALKEDPMARVEAALERSLALISTKPEVLVRVHPTMAGPLKERLAGLWQERHFTTTLSIQAEAEIPPTDLRVEWKDGGLSTDTERLWGEIEKVLEETL